MQFKYPEIFYFLCILIIPILVHLFQLQKFKKIAFTNVQFLKKISLETRKSSRLKKLLILTTRLIIFLAILFTFSKPYFSKKKESEKNHNYIYLDNSMSLNTNDSNGDQLKITAQNIIKYASENDQYTLVTNDNIYRDITKKELDFTLKSIEHSTKNSLIKEKILYLESENNNEIKSLNKNILISDFQFINKNKKKEFTNVNTPISVVKLNNSQKNNISIDSIYIKTKTTNEISLFVVVKNQGGQKNNIPIALYNKKQLINKHSFSIGKNSLKELIFKFPKATNFNGKLQVTFNDIFIFDNTFYFTINSQAKTNVLAIGKPSITFPKIFLNDDFLYQEFSVQNINYNSISKQQLIILNQLENIPKTLQNSILDFIKNGGDLLIIPNQNISIDSYNSFFRKITSGKIISQKKDSLKITNINFQHPLFKNVFSKEVSNFQYPSSRITYSNNLKGDPIISFNNSSPFLQEIDNEYSKIYWFSTPLDIKSTNFSNSPLIVPTLFNIAQQSLEFSNPYYYLQEENKIDVNTKTEKDEVLKISNGITSFIPLQQSFANKVTLTTSESPKNEGFYSIVSKKDTLQSLAFNINKEESALSFYDMKNVANRNEKINFYDSIEQLFKEINTKNEVQWLWKLFLTIAIVSLLLEILILKFFRT